MKHLKIAYSFDVQYYFVDSEREIVPIEETDFTDVAVAVVSDQDFAYIDKIDATGFGIPIMNSYNNRSILNISGQWVCQDTKMFIKENSFRINIGLTFNERWFAKWKVD